MICQLTMCYAQHYHSKQDTRMNQLQKYIVDNA